MKKTIAIVDAGCRGAILAESYSQHPEVAKILAFPGNDLMQLVSTKPVMFFPEVSLTNVKSIVRECKKHKVDMVEVCQDDAVASGVVNALRSEGIPTIGHTKEAGIIEWDKAWCRLFLRRIGLNEYQPKFHIFTSAKEGIEFIQNQPNRRWFIKAAGLAAGKGALGAKSNDEAIQRIKELKQRFSEAAKKYLIEEWVMNEDGTYGEEFSYYALCKGNVWKFEGNYQDHKRVYDFDDGENTGGMGSISPTKVITPDVLSQIKTILDSVVINMKDEVDENGRSRELSGDLYLGGMITKKNGKPQVKIIEFNARLGDPEAHTVLGVKTNRYDIAKAMIGVTDFGKLKIKVNNSIRVILTGAAKGYPLDYSAVLGNEIFGLDMVMKRGKVNVYGAGIKVKRKRFFVNGGRLFYLFGEGKDLVEARRKVYAEMSQIYVEGNNLHYRKDIGHSELEKFWKAIKQTSYRSA